MEGTEAQWHAQPESDNLEQGELLGDQEPLDQKQPEQKDPEIAQEAHSENCLERTFHCLGHVPCASLVAWIALFIGLGGVTGSLLVGTERTRDLLEDDRMSTAHMAFLTFFLLFGATKKYLLLWFMEYTLIGVIAGMFVIGSCLLVLGHCSSDPTSRHAFNTSKKNTCGRALNIFMLVLSYILLLAWIFVSAILTIPVGALMLLIILKDYKNVRCVELSNYGFRHREICETELERFTNEGRDLLVCYTVAYFSAVLVIISLVHFLMCISANITHLRDARFATLNAYEEAEDAQPAKQLNDTTM